jgi:hypothetical protein
MDTDEPLLRVVRGSPTPEELAALVSAVRGRHRAGTPGRFAAGSAWARSARPGHTGAIGTRRGPRAWRASALPR